MHKPLMYLKRGRGRPALERKDPQAAWPSRWTVCEILKREGLVREQTRRRKVGHPGKPTSIVTAPNQLWCVDFKGQFKTRDGLYCYPLTVTDSYSRYLIGCQALLSTQTAGTKEVFQYLFKQYGLPRQSAQTTGRPLLRRPWDDSQRCPSGGFSSASGQS